VPGAALTGWYFVVDALPAVRKITMTALHAAISSPVTVSGAAGAVCVVLTAASAGYVRYGLARTVSRISRPWAGKA
jgi:hypothetical protein